MTPAGGLKRTCFHLGDQDRAAISRICDRLDLPSSALAIRIAIRDLAKRLEAGQTATIAGRSLPEQNGQPSGRPGPEVE